MKNSSDILLAVLLAVTIAILYHPLTQYGYVQDDRGMLQHFVTQSTTETITSAFSPTDTRYFFGMFYRPMGVLYCAGIFWLFGSNPIGFHILALAILFASSMLVVLIARELTQDKLTAWSSGFLYAVAVQIHFDTQLWMVGIFEIGAAVFSLLCIYLFMRKRYILSTIGFALALGFKESAVMILPILAAYTLYWRNWKKEAQWLVPITAIFLIWAYCKSFGVDSFSLPPDNPYATRLQTSHLPLYAEWLSTLTVQGTVGIIILCALVLLAYKNPERGVFLATWGWLALIPPLSLLTHTFHYYLIPALPAVVIAMMCGIHAIIKDRKLAGMVSIALIVFNILMSATFIQGHVIRGINDDIPAINDGYNHLVRKALRGQ